MARESAGPAASVMSGGRGRSTVAGTALTVASLLRAWRVEVVGVTAAEVARALGVSRSAIANWETGARFPDRVLLEALDACYQAGGALIDMVRALGTPDGLERRHRWWHDPDGDGGPLWTWVRPAPGTSTVRLRWRWGPLGVHLERPCDQRGLMVTVPISVASPPLEARMDPPGWVDFGRGYIPPELGIPVVSALAAGEVVDNTDAALHVIASRLRPVLNGDGRWVETIVDLLGTRGDLVAAALEGSRPPPPVEDLVDAGGQEEIHSLSWPGCRYRALREARRLSRAEAAEGVTALDPALPLSEDQLGVFERGGAPRVRHVAARLDVLYGADGLTLCEPLSAVTVVDELAHAAIPPWWRGPVWVSAVWPDQAGPRQLVVSWPPWLKRVRVRPGAVLATRKPAGERRPLLVSGPEGCVVRFGVGIHPGALEIVNGWRVEGEQAVNAVFNRYYPIYMGLFDKSPDELLQLLSSVRGRDRGRSDQR